MIEINRHTLSNGLRIVHNKNAATQMAALNILYCVGSRNESYEYTGLAHLLEHLMFGGSENAPCFDIPLQEAGGENNAWTSNDITNYFEVLPVQNLETAMWLEADRMRSLSLSDRSVEVQRSVVMEEFKQRYLNMPYGDVGHLWRKMVYEKHPYRWPVIGKDLSDIENVPKEVVRDFYKRFYAPDNAVLSIVGNIDADKVFALVEKWFGDVPRSGFVQPSIPEEPRQIAARSLHVKRDVPQDLLVKVFRMCGRKGADYHACDMISDVLSNGRSSRLFRNIYAKGTLVSSVDASITGDLDGGALVVRAQLLPGVAFEAVEAALETEFDRLRSGDVQSYELEKNVNRFESSTLFGNINNDERASNLAYFEMLGDAGQINREAELYKSITPVRFAEVCRQVLCPENCSTLYYESRRK